MKLILFMAIVKNSFNLNVWLQHKNSAKPYKILYFLVKVNEQRIDISKYKSNKKIDITLNQIQLANTPFWERHSSFSL